MLISILLIIVLLLVIVSRRMKGPAKVWIFYFTGFLVGILIAAITGFLCYEKGHEDGATRMIHPTEYWENVIQLDKELLINIDTQPNLLTSGTYNFETKFPNKNVEEYKIELIFSNGQLIENTIIEQFQNKKFSSFIQDGKMVYGSIFIKDEGPRRIYIGVIDGNMIWGKAYMPGHYGWNIGPSEIGVWRIY